MQQDVSRKRAWMPSPGMVIAIIALFAALGGSAIAAKKHGGKLGKNSVGSRQLKAKAVTGAKIANNAVNGTKVANGSLSGSDIDLNALGKVPSAATSDGAGNANTVAGHAAACPGGTVLIRGVCFDGGPVGQASSLAAASDACASRGGYLPDPLELSSTAGVLNLGSGTPPHFQYTDTYYGNTAGSQYHTILVSNEGMIEKGIDEDAEYICAYPLVR
jgi:hypothetical protein